MGTVIRRRHQRVWHCLFPICLLALLRAPQPQSPEPPLEYQVKAAFLLNFTKFVEWPASVSASDSPIAICILGKDPFGRSLDDIVEGESIGSRKLAVERIVQLPAPPSCRVIFVSGSEKDLPKIVSGFGQGVLTVGEGDKFVRDGGMIAFVVVAGHVRFDVNPRAAAGAGLKLSSKLISIARAVEK